MTVKKLIVLALALAMAASVIACGPAQDGGANTTAAPATTQAAQQTTTAAPATTQAATTEATTEAEAKPALDTSERVNLISYMPGDASEDCDRVAAEVNKILLDKLNCTVTFNFLTWADYQGRYRLLLTSGEQVDMIYSANWLTDRVYARQNAWIWLEDLLPVVTPDLYAFITEVKGEYGWIDASEGGHIYAIPCASKGYRDGGVIYREDLRKKHDLPIPNTLENLEAFCLGIKENEPGMVPMLEPSSAGVAGYAGYAALELMQLEHMRFAISNEGVMVGYTTDRDGKFSYRDVVNYYESDMAIEDLKVMKRFLDNGFWSRNALSNPIDDPDGAFRVGQCAVRVAGQNGGKWSGYNSQAALDGNDWEFTFLTYKGFFNSSSPVQPTQDAMAFPRQGCRNVERALAVTEMYVLNQEVFNLIMYGIEGEHYTKDENNFYQPGPNNVNFPQGSFNFWNIDNINFGLLTPTEVVLREHYAELDNFKKVYPLPFSLDTTSVETECAAFLQVREQYFTPLAAGLSNDIEADLANFIDRAKAVGYEKAQQNYIDQWLAFCEERGLE